MKLWLFVLWLGVQSQAAKILFIAPIPSISHNLYYQPLIRELCDRGHQVTSITTHPNNDSKIKNLTEINIHDEAYGVVNIGEYLINAQSRKPSAASVFLTFSKIGTLTFESVCQKQEIQQVMKEQYDLIIQEFFGYSTFVAWKDHFKCPMIGIASAQILSVGYDSVGNPVYPSFHVDNHMYSGVDLTFMERLSNFMNLIEITWGWYGYGLQFEEEIYEKNTGLKIDFRKSYRSFDLLLMNSNSVFHGARPLVPALIEISGLHIQKSKGLPKDLQTYLDAANQGAIYFSLGSNIQSKNLPLEIFDGVIKAFEQIPYQVLWKWEDEYLPNRPVNVRTQKWLPQQAILNHPNVKAFVSQCGIQSLEESIYYKVPVICIPFGPDQFYNSRRVKSLEIGERIYFQDLTASTLARTLREIIENPRYAANMSKVSNLIWDTPMTGLDKATWWIDYVIRHKGAEHLRSPSVDMHWFKLWSLDIISFLFGALVLGLVVCYFIVRFIIRLFFKVNVNKVKSH